MSQMTFTVLLSSDPFPLLQWCAPAVASHLSLKAEVSFVSKAAKRVETHLKTKAFFIQPGWWEDRLGLAGVWDKAAQGSLVSQHMQTHLPGKPKSSAAEVNPSSLACKPLGFRLNEPGRKAEVSKITHSQGGLTKKRGRDGNIFNSGVPAKRSTSSLQNDFPPEHNEIF